MMRISKMLEGKGCPHDQRYKRQQFTDRGLWRLWCTCCGAWLTEPGEHDPRVMVWGRPPKKKRADPKEGQGKLF